MLQDLRVPHPNLLPKGEGTKQKSPQKPCLPLARAGQYRYTHRMNSPANLPRIAASVLAANSGRLADELSAMTDAGADFFHWDIMDGHFVPNLSFGPHIVKNLRPLTNKIFDVHLMVNHPSDWIDAFADAGADCISFHTETVADTFKLIEKIKARDIIVGLAINPDTNLNTIDDDVFKEIDRVLIMTVRPGFGGQEFIDQSAKIKTIHAKYPKLDIMVDGGINLETAPIVLAAGATSLVTGSALFNAPDKKEFIAQLKAGA
jgi:ribulose-phosphate 3-epimerase